MLLKTSFKAGAIGFCLLLTGMVGLGGFAIGQLRIGSADYQAIIRDCTSSEVLRQAGFGFSGEWTSSGVDI